MSGRSPAPAVAGALTVTSTEDLDSVLERLRLNDPQLKNLCLRVGLAQAGAGRLMQVLRVNSYLRVLELDGAVVSADQKIGAEGATKLATALQRHHSLTRLHLNFQNLGDDGVSAIECNYPVSDRDGWFPAHTYIFMEWEIAGSTEWAWVVDNQERRHLRNIMAPGPRTMFQYFVRYPAD